MGQEQLHALKREIAFFFKKETTYDTQVKPVTTDAIKCLSCSITPDIQIDMREENNGSRDRTSVIKGISTVAIDAETEVVPSGSAGTAPDVGPLLQMLLGTETINGGVSAAYTTSDTQGDQGSASMYVRRGLVQMDAASGVWIESGTLNLSGTDLPKLSFSGGAATHYHTGRSTCDGAVSGTTVNVQSGDGKAFSVGSIIQVGSDTNSGAGFKVTAISTDALTIEASATADSGSVVAPFTPTETTAGDPVPGIKGSVEVDSIAVPITGFDVTIANKHKPLDDVYGSSKVTDYIEGTREITGNIKVRCRADQVDELGKWKDVTTRDLAVQVGDTAGDIMTVNIDYAVFTSVGLEDGDDDSSIINIGFTAIGSSGNDAIEIIFT